MNEIQYCEKEISELTWDVGAISSAEIKAIGEKHESILNLWKMVQDLHIHTQRMEDLEEEHYDYLVKGEIMENKDAND